MIFSGKLSRTPIAPAEILRALPRREKALAAALAADETWLVGSGVALHLVGYSTRSIPWEQVEAATWDQDNSRVRITEVGVYGEQRPAHEFTLSEPRALLELTRERVTASVVLQRRVQVAGKRGFSVIGRRPPSGGEITWMHEYDAGIDPEDVAVKALAEAALSAARSEVGL